MRGATSTGTPASPTGAQDFPRADRHFSLAVRRLTRVHVRSVEQVVNLDEGDEFDWPWLYAVQVGEWGLTDAQGQALREYLLRGGFFMADDFHGSLRVGRVRKARSSAPSRTAISATSPTTIPIFHTVYDSEGSHPDARAGACGLGYKLRFSDGVPEDGKGAHWRGIYDDKGRVMIAISYNSDIGDAWEYADDPALPGAILRPGDPVGRKLRRVCDDALVS